MGEDTLCITFTIREPNESPVDLLEFSFLEIKQPSCSLADGSNFDLHVALYDTSGQTRFDESWDDKYVCSDYATKCTFDPGSRTIDINKHRWAFVCDENAPVKDIFASLEFDDPTLDCDPEGCFDRTGMFTCTFTALLDPDTGEDCSPSDIDADVKITGDDTCVDSTINLDCPANPGDITLFNDGSPGDLWEDLTLDGTEIWPDASTKCTVEIEVNCSDCPLNTGDYDISIQREVQGCKVSKMENRITMWGINGTDLYSTFASANPKYEQTFWITNYSPLNARILVTVLGMQADNQSGASPSPVIGASLAELGWIGTGKSTVGFQLAELEEAIFGNQVDHLSGLFWVCFTVQTKAVSGHTVLGTLQNGPEGLTADYTLYKMEFKNGGEPAVVLDVFGRQTFPFPDDDD